MQVGSPVSICMLAILCLMMVMRHLILVDIMYDAGDESNYQMEIRCIHTILLIHTHTHTHTHILAIALGLEN